MEKLNEQQIEIIKKNETTKYVIDSERYGISIPDLDYKELTGIDMKTLDRMYGETHVYNEVRYCNLDGEIELHYETIINDSFNAELSGVFKCDDFLGLFSTKKTEDIHEKLQELFDNHFNEFEEFLKEKDYTRSEDLSGEYIKKEAMTADDVSEELKDDIIDDYFEHNSYDALEKAWDNADSSDKRDKVIDYIQDNL